MNTYYILAPIFINNRTVRRHIIIISNIQCTYMRTLGVDDTMANIGRPTKMCRFLMHTSKDQ